MTANEKKHIANVKALPCAVCGESGPSDAHHILQGRTPGRKAPDMLVIPLCKSCHQDPHNGIHGMKSMWNVMKVSEFDCLADTITKVAYQ